MALFEPLAVGAVTLKNRILLAPLTRTRATLPGHVPTDIMTEYYAQRASAGLIIAEATMIAEKRSAFYAEPGIYSQEQVAAWKKVTDAVHANGGLIFLQIWHGGRACHPLNNDGEASVAPSAIACTHRIGAEFNPTGQPVEPSLPRSLTTAEVKAIVGDFATAALNARAAGFDGVEIHGANGYLVDEFLRTSSNQRDDEYGGSLENRTRFALEVVDAVSSAIGADRVGIRLSPLNSYNDMKDEDPIGLTTYLAQELNKRKIAFIHMMRGDFFGAQQGDVITPARENFNGALFVNMGYTPEEAETVVGKKQADAVAFGTKFLANPDLPARIAKKAELNPPNPATFYGRDAMGYTDYPALTN